MESGGLRREQCAREGGRQPRELKSQLIPPLQGDNFRRTACLPAACTGPRQEQAPALQGQDLSCLSPGRVVGILLQQSLCPPSAGNGFPSSLSKTLPCLRART